MNFESGAIINQYKILSLLGNGGMGEVFLAQDTKLDRKVAVKFLSEEFARDADKLSRFVQEAKAASALNHPNILTVYEIGEADGVNFIAAEFIDGETLRERMKRRLTFDETLSILIQTAEALSAAHRAGIVHRDIKPENVMVRADGYVKVLDFGLAKLAESSAAATAGSDGEEATKKLVRTNPGVVMGTVAYMSPEQARGLKVDVRSDIFSFGVMMYEILAGQLPFAGETTMDVIAAVLNSEPPPLQSLAAHLPQELIGIVHRTLKKKRDRRYQLTADLLNDLKDLRDELHLEAKLERTAVPNKSESGQSAAPTRPLTSSGGGVKDSLLLIDFENTTGDDIFDQTLKTALAFSLAQSPFLDIAPDAKVAQSLRRMKRPSDERVTREIAEEICLRLNLKAYLAGSISNLGTIYFLTLEAVNARNGESIGREFEQANSKEEILAALGRAATGIREKLGESLSSIQKFDLPLEITTSSFEALKYYSFGRQQSAGGKYLEAIPFYRKALEYDPGFAVVYAGLAGIYANTNQWKQARELVTKAFELRDSVGELEKLRITTFYYLLGTGEMDKAIATLELWRKTYTLTISPVVNLADCYIRFGQFEKAVAVCREAASSAVVLAAFYDNLASALLALNRFAEAGEAFRQALEKNVDTDYSHLTLYQIAFVERDAAAMNEHLQWFVGRSDEYLALDAQAGAAAFHGQWRKAQDFSRRAIELANRSGAKEVAAKSAADQALRIVFWSSAAGLPKADDNQLKTVLKTQTNNALNLERAKDVLSRAALALACAGQTAETLALIDELHAEGPKDTLLNELWLPAIRAALLLQTGKAKEAVEELEITERFERAAEFYPQYLRGLAYLQLKKPKQAVVEFDKIINHRGESPLSSIYPLAQLGKARAVKDKAEYEKFFELWKDADKDMPALTVAKKESENLS